jgi:molybdopterin molybdotransferase
MKSFFKVKSVDDVLDLTQLFTPVSIQLIPVEMAYSRVLAEDIQAPENMPGFRRATMDGYAVHAAATFGASESNPAWLIVQGTIAMGEVPKMILQPGQAVRISTGGMLPDGADAVVMVEHTQVVDDQSVEIYKSVAPMQHVIDADEDFSKSQVILKSGTCIRPQEQGMLAGMGIMQVAVFKQPKVGIISTGDEIVPIDQPLSPGRIRDINSYTLSGLVHESNGVPVTYGIVKDDPELLLHMVRKAVDETDMVLISGGSSVGTKDYTIDVLNQLPDTRILVHGISVSPGKPTILAQSGNTPVWGLPGQVTSAMVVVKIIAFSFLARLKGCSAVSYQERAVKVRARLSRNIASTQGRRDFIRVSLQAEGEHLCAQPVLGKSGLLRTMIQADGLLEIKDDVEGLEKDSLADIILL